MRRSIRATLGLIAAVIGCAAASSAKADTITATLTGLDPYVFGHIDLQGAGSLDGGIGNILWQGASTNAAPFNGAFNTYCIDLIQDIYFGSTYTFTVGSLSSSPKAGAYPGGTPANGMGAAKATEIQELFGQNYAATLGSTQAAADNREGFQLAIWNIIYDTDASVSTGSGTFYAGSDVSANAITAANNFLAEAMNPTDQLLYQATDLVTLIGQDGAQDQIAIDPLVATTSSTPLPSAALSGSVLLAGIALARWRRNSLLRNSL